METEDDVICIFCRSIISPNYYIYHMFTHYGFMLFQCGFKNCRTEFLSEEQIELHCQLKHYGASKVKFCKFIL